VIPSDREISWPWLAPRKLTGISHHGRKGGALAPPFQHPHNYSRVSWPAPRAAPSCTGHETDRRREAALAAGLKPRPSGGPMKRAHPVEKSRLASRTLWLVIALLLASSLSLRAQAPAAKRATDQDVQKLVQTASAALDRGDFQAALPALKSIVEVQPDLVGAWFNLGYAYSALKQNEEAIQAYRKALELQPDLYEARLNLGILLLELKRPAEALPHLEKAAMLKAGLARPHFHLGRALAQTGQAAAAAKQFQEAVKIEPGFALAYFELGQLDLEQKHSAEAQANFQKAMELNPKLATQARLGLVMAAEQAGDPAQSIAQLESYLTTQPDDLEARLRLARIYQRQGNAEKALENYQKVYQTKPDFPGLAATLGDVYYCQKKYEEAEKYYRQALKVSPSDPGLLRPLGDTLLLQKKFADAEAQFRAALKLDPRRETLLGLATAVYFQERYPEAIPMFETLTRAASPSANLFYLLATCYDHLRDRPKALEAYERFLALSHGQDPDGEWRAQQRVKLLRRVLGK
jgi:tetratricopeptide (TPR) repeat protein